jgi:GNAT superfamily N-acetyltransferase
MERTRMMDVLIRPFHDDDAEQIVTLSLRAWEPVFRSFENVLGAAIFPRLYPDWRTEQAAVVLDYCRRDTTDAWVADLDGALAGFIVYELNHSTRVGEVHLLAVHPDYQNRGIGTRLNDFALGKLAAAGMHLAVVGTGGDPGHAPARRSYEKAGYTALPLVRYYKAL